MKLTASGAGDAFIAVGIVSYFLAQPALDVEAGIRASEHECGYQNVGDVLCANAKSWCVFVGLTLPGRCQGNRLRALRPWRSDPAMVLRTERTSPGSSESHPISVRVSSPITSTRLSLARFADLYYLVQLDSIILAPHVIEPMPHIAA